MQQKHSERSPRKKQPGKHTTTALERVRRRIVNEKMDAVSAPASPSQIRSNVKSKWKQYQNPDQFTELAQLDSHIVNYLRPLF
ncbi:hypothetical protein VTN77DRAFT_6742 [Rasamsonia byssochlamydoides]|uniref:uncharacterized protein n=1 Tax=Rasamsonia byssochlamydoides TaxID=89139 RepID=UPI0037434780